MGKRVITTDDMEMSTIKEHLNRQDVTMKEILTLLRGSVSMGVEGIIPKLKEINTNQIQIIEEVEQIQLWRKDIEDNKGKITITFGQMFTRVMALIGGIGTVIAILLGLRELLTK